MWSCGLVKSFAPLQFAQHHASMTFWNSNWTLFGTPAGLPTYPKHVKATTWFLASAGRMLIVCSHCNQFIDLGKPWITWLMVNPEMSCWYGGSCVCVCAFFFLVGVPCAFLGMWSYPMSLHRRNFVFQFNLPNKCKNYPEIKERTVNRPRRKVDPKMWPRTFNGSEFLLERLSKDWASIAGWFQLQEIQVGSLRDASCVPHPMNTNNEAG